jgi:hypothetical protein
MYCERLLVAVLRSQINHCLSTAYAFFEGLNEVMIVFSDSKDVSKALIEYNAALNTPNANDRLITLFKAICRDVGIDPNAFNDSLFLRPFTDGRS